VLDWDPAPPPLSQKGGTAAPTFRPMYCGQTTGWIKMPLGTEVGLGAGDICYMGTQLPPQKKGHSSPQFSAHDCCGQTAGWVKLPLGMEVGLGPGHIVLDWDDPAPPKGHSPSPIIGPCLLRPNGWMDQDATWQGGRPRQCTLC